MTGGNRDRGKRARSRSPLRGSGSSSSSSSKRSVSVKDRNDFKKPVDKLSRILQGNAKIPQNAALLDESNVSKTSVCYIYTHD